jgi:hypothetical protein
MDASLLGCLIADEGGEEKGVDMRLEEDVNGELSSTAIASV